MEDNIIVSYLKCKYKGFPFYARYNVYYVDDLKKLCYNLNDYAYIVKFFSQFLYWHLLDMVNNLNYGYERHERKGNTKFNLSEIQSYYLLFK